MAADGSRQLWWEGRRNLNAEIPARYENNRIKKKRKMTQGREERLNVATITSRDMTRQCDPQESYKLGYEQAMSSGNVGR